MDYQALELLKSLHEKLEAQERIRAQEKAEQELIRAQEKAEQELIRAQEQKLLLETFVEQEKRLNAKIEEIQEESRKNHAEIKEQLTRIENHVLIIRGNVVPIDLDGITPETKDELQELCTEAYDEYVETPNKFDPRLLTPHDPRPNITPTLSPPYSLNKMKENDLFRVTFVLNEENQTHSKKVVFGDFTSKFSKALWGYNFNGWYPVSTLQIIDKLQHYFFKERSNSQLVQTGRWT